MIDLNAKPGKLDHVVLAEGRDGYLIVYQQGGEQRFIGHQATAIAKALAKTNSTYKAVGVAKLEASG